MLKSHQWVRLSYSKLFTRINHRTLLQENSTFSYQELLFSDFLSNFLPCGLEPFVTLVPLMSHGTCIRRERFLAVCGQVDRELETQGTRRHCLCDGEGVREGEKHVGQVVSLFHTLTPQLIALFPVFT